MALGFSKTRYSPIAIDFGADSIKVLQIVPNNPPQLVAAAQAPIPEHARSDNAARAAFLTESLRNLLKLEPFKGRRAILAMPAFQTLVQHMELPVGEHEDISAQVKLQLQTRLNVDPSRMVIRDFPVAQVVRNGSQRQEVVCIAAPRDTVMRYIDIARRCKLDVVGMHTEPQSILRAFSQSDKADGVTCFVDIGAASSKVVIGWGDELVFAKAVHAAGDHVTRRIAGSRSISFTDARQARIAEIRGGAQFDGVEAGPLAAVATIDTPRLTPKPLTPGGSRQGEDPYTETVDCLIDELRMCLRHYASICPDRPVEKLVFLGGESANVKTCQAIARGVKTAAQLGDPFARLMRIGRKISPTGLDLNHPQPGWAVPMGLCLSEANL